MAALTGKTKQLNQAVEKNIYLVDRSKYKVKITRNNTTHKCGPFETIDEARAARDEWLAKDNYVQPIPEENRNASVDQQLAEMFGLDNFEDEVKEEVITSSHSHNKKKRNEDMKRLYVKPNLIIKIKAKLADTCDSHTALNYREYLYIATIEHDDKGLILAACYDSHDLATQAITDALSEMKINKADIDTVEEAIFHDAGLKMARGIKKLSCSLGYFMD